MEPILWNETTGLAGISTSLNLRMGGK